MKAATMTLCLGTLALNAAAQSTAAPRAPSTLPSTAPSTASTAPALPAPHDAPRAAATAPGAMPSRGFACLIEPTQRLELRSPVEARIDSILVERGDEVKKGQLLVQLDSGAERAALDAARYRAVMEGQLKSAESRLVAARDKYQRREQLVKEKFIAAQDRDDSLAEMQVAEANLLEAKDNRRLASIEQQRISELLEQRRIRSPINGVVTERLILHVLGVMGRCRTIEEKTVALLHDVVEDGHTTFAALRRKGFSERILEAVERLTRRPGERYDDFVERIAPDPLARAVKLADLEDNMDVRRSNRAMGQKDAERMEKYRRAWQRLARLHGGMDYDSSK